MSAAATLSVILPNYNHARFVARALKALLAQSLPADEIIVIDDASTDDSVRVIEELAKSAPAITLLCNAHNAGVNATLDRGLQTARGKYIYFAAADDFVLPGFFELAVRRLDSNPDLGLFCGEAVLVEGRTNRPFAVRPAVRPRMSAGRINPPRVRSMLKKSDNWILTGSTVFRRECVLWAGGLDNRLGPFADGMLGRKLALKFGFFFQPKPVATWVIFSDSHSRRTAVDLDKTRYFLDAVPAWLAADPVFPNWYADLFRDRWRFATCRLALQSYPIDRDLILAMGGRSARERAELEQIMALPECLRRLALLVQLWYRLRPTSLIALLRTTLGMRTMRLAFDVRFGEIRDETTADDASH
jgi:glycosyltransferase involved in cell wall biosynthesis